MNYTEAKNDAIRLKVFCLPITLRCNLKYKLCGAHSPYYKNPYHPTLNSIKRQIDALFDVVGFIDKFDIGGGEPFLRIDLPDIMNFLYQTYREQIGHLRIITNGTLMPLKGSADRDSFVQAAIIWNDDFNIIIDKYPVDANKSEAVADYLHQYGVNSEVRDYTDDLHCGGWVDFGDLTLKYDDLGGKRMFEKCSVPRQGFFTSICDGKLFPCGRARILYERGFGTDYVNLADETLNIEYKRNQLYELLFKGNPLKTCKYCNGMCDDSIRYKPAEQLT
ncbi:MAG: hypothetical protein LBJ36_02210 [Synergistaceae bacterium]|jgi:hypothetical protein|nr:hypothetical protein [Synergistaceae bacterium]